MTVLQVTCHADMIIENDRLTVTTNRYQVVFKGAELIRFSNKLTQETYISSVAPKNPVLDLTSKSGIGGQLTCTGWRRGKATAPNADVAQTQFSDLKRSIWMNVILDPDTEDLTITVFGDAQQQGISGLRWGMRGIDITTGKLILPAQGGRYADMATMPEELSFNYPGDWQAQMALWQSDKGGFILYSHDDEVKHKRLTLKRSGHFADVLIDNIAQAPFETNSHMASLEWRMNVYKGDWRVPAVGYRSVMAHFREPTATTGKRAWIKNMRTVVNVIAEGVAADAPDKIAERVDPSKTMLLLTNWRAANDGENYPSYDWKSATRSFVERAHSLGFRVMLPIHVGAISTSSSDYSRFAKYQCRDSETGQPIGNRWQMPSSAKRYAIVNPSASPWRQNLLGKLRPLMDEVQPDGLYLVGLDACLNDANPTLQSRSYLDGCASLMRSLLTQYPNIALGADNFNEVVKPYIWFGRSTGTAGLPPHPITGLLFSDHIIAFADPDGPHSTFAVPEWLSRQRVYEGQGVTPCPVYGGTFPANHEAFDWRLAMEHQMHNLAPNGNGDWEHARFRWRGSDDTEAVAHILPGGGKFTVGEDTIYQYINAVTHLVTSGTIPNWPAYDENGPIALNPLRTLPVTPSKSKAALHVAKVGLNIHLESATVTDQFAVFRFANNRTGPLESADFTLNTGTGQQEWQIVSGVGETSGPSIAVHCASSAAFVVKSAVAASDSHDLIKLAPIIHWISGGIGLPGNASTNRKIESGINAERSIEITPPAEATTSASWLVGLKSKQEWSFTGKLQVAEGALPGTARWELRLNGQTMKAGSVSDGTSELNVPFSSTGLDRAIVQLVVSLEGSKSGMRVWLAAPSLK